MTEDEAEKAIIGVLTDIQRTSGRPCGVITGATTPLGELDGFDSYNAIEATALVESALGCTIKAHNLLAIDTPNGTRPLTIAEAAREVVRLAAPRMAQ